MWRGRGCRVQWLRWEWPQQFDEGLEGNKRTGFVAAELFLRLNGWALTADDASCVLTMLAVAAGDISEEAFAAWLRGHAVARI